MSVSPSAAGVGYRESVVHFWADRLPPILRAALPPGPLALADFGCGDGPWFHALQAGGYISPERPVYAVDLSEPRLRRVVDAFPYIHPCIASVDDAPSIPSGSLDFVISTMVLEHVEDELGYFRELRRVVRTGGRVYCTTPTPTSPAIPRPSPTNLPARTTFRLHLPGISRDNRCWRWTDVQDEEEV
jgi:SAM-dependent methyltransferase